MKRIHGPRTFFFVLILLLSNFGWTKSITYKSHRFSVDFPAEWQEVEDFFGVPVTILGPFQKNESRPLVQIIPIGKKGLKFTDQELKRWNENHRKNSKAWMDKHGGEIQSIWDGKVETKKDGTKQIVAGLTYQLKTKAFYEKIYYISCPKGFYNLKVLVNQGSKEFVKPAEEIAESFTCGK